MRSAGFGIVVWATACGTQTEVRPADVASTTSTGTANDGAGTGGSGMAGSPAVTTSSSGEVGGAGEGGAGGTGGADGNGGAPPTAGFDWAHAFGSTYRDVG